MRTLYLAGAIFTEAEQTWLRDLSQTLKSKLGVDVFWAFGQQDGKKLALHEIFELCKHGLDDADAVVAVLDGTQVDDGTAWEVGYFWALHRGPVFGLRTDFRKAGELPGSRVNAMIEASCTSIVADTETLVDAVSNWLKDPPVFGPNPPTSRPRHSTSLS